MLWAVVVETTDSSGQHDRYQALVLAHSDRAAKIVAGKAVDKLRGIERRFIEATVVDPYHTGLVSLVPVEEERATR